MQEDLSAISNQYAKKKELQLHLMKLHSILLNKLENAEIVKYSLDKFFQTCHEDYGSHSINLNIPIETATSMEMREGVADCFAYASTRWFDIVIDKMRNIFNPEII